MLWENAVKQKTQQTPKLISFISVTLNTQTHLFSSRIGEHYIWIIQNTFLENGLSDEKRTLNWKGLQ